MQQFNGVVEAGIFDVWGFADVIEAANDTVVPGRWVSEVGESVLDDLASFVGAVEVVVEHEFESAGFGFLKLVGVDKASFGGGPEAFEDIEGGME